ncbi:hypothetical protein [Nonomuraea dietziae]|uniref:Uncharacterized protein n=1 Tax=Nonomuraea dietziae TaxID=65515 RepID=A0A7W5VB81_9ACTN|nr:hypothetical protein [Nonomuraea dietziae]MBB3734082.1 hypothetical protein [Nonomuraea dietziae]
MLPEVKAYFDAIRDRSYHIEHDRVYREHPVPAWDHTMPPDQIEAYFEAEGKRTAALQALESAHKKKQADAYQDLMKSESALVRFLLTDPEVRSYSDHAEVVLKALPMTREEMEDFGNQRGWCSEFGRLLERAEKAGVLPEPVPDLADIDALVNDLQDLYGTSARRLRPIIIKHLAAIIASATARAAQEATA